MKLFAYPVAALLLIPAAPSATAQTMQPHLDSQRWSNALRHQQRMRAKAAAARAKAGAQPHKAQISRSERLNALVRHRGEYNRVARSDGTAAADRWLEGMILRARR